MNLMFELLIAQPGLNNLYTTEGTDIQIGLGDLLVGIATGQALPGVISFNGRTGNVVSQTGDYTTDQITEASNLYFTQPRVLATTLTGYVSAPGTITSADSILSAIEKLNGNQDAGPGAISIHVDGSNSPTATINWAGYGLTNVSLSANTLSISGLSGVLKAIGGNVVGSSTTTDLPEGSSLYYTPARTLGTQLTGYSAAPGTITPSDTVLTAIEKLSGNLSSGVLTTQLTGYVSGPGVITPSDTILSAIEKLNGNDVSTVPGGSQYSIQTNNGSSTFFGDSYFLYNGSQAIFNLVDSWGGLQVLGRSGGEASIALQSDTISGGSAGQWILATNGSDLTNPLDFAIYNAPTGIAFYIQQATNFIGIGQTNPAYTLDVNGSINSASTIAAATSLSVPRIITASGDLVLAPASGNVSLSGNNITNIWTLQSDEGTWNVINDGSASFASGALSWTATGVLSLVNGNGLRFNGSSDANWQIGRNLTTLVSPWLSTQISTNTLEFICGNGSGEGFVFGNNSGVHYFELDSNANAWFAHNINIPNSINLASLTPSTALVSDSSKNITSSSVLTTELVYLSGITTGIYTNFTPTSASIVGALMGIDTALGSIDSGAITSLTGDVTGTGPGATSTSLVATSNSTLTSLSALTNANSLILTGDVTGTVGSTALTATSNSTLVTLSALSLPTSQLTGTVSAAQMLPLTENYIYIGDASNQPVATSISGDATLISSGTLTLATVNSDTGPFGSSTAIPTITVNAKGLVTAVTTNDVIAPAGTLSGTVLASNVVTSSLTSLGIQAQALNMGGFQINDLANPSVAQDAATKYYVDNAINGLTWKGPVQAYSNSNVPLTGSTPLVVDSYTVLNGDSLILANQTTPSQNYVYSAAISGGSYTLTQIVGFDAPSTIGDAYLVSNGTLYGNTAVQVNAITPNVTFIEFAGPNVLSFTAPLSLTGSTVSISQANTSTNGYLSATDWNTFNNKQPAGNYITALTGDGTASGPGSATFTLATVATAGTTGSSTAIPVITINAKGLTTSITTTAVIAPAGTLSGTTLNSTVVSSSLTSVGTIGTGTWAGTTVAIAHGGTGSTSVTQWGVSYASTTTTLASTAAGAANRYLTGNGSAAPTFQQVSLTAGVTGILPVANGGTGSSSVIYATRTLNNLTSPTAINQSLLPGVTDGSLVLGSQTNYWGPSLISQLLNGASNLAIDVFNGFMSDGDGAAGISIDFVGRYLYDSTDTPVRSMDFGSRFLIDSSATEQINWSAENAATTALGVQFIQLSASTVPYLDANNVLVSSAVTPTQLSYVDATSSIQTQLNDKQPTGNYITALTGDVTASGPGSSVASLVATSNATLTTLSALTTANSLTLSGDVGGTAGATVLATVNSNVGSFGSSTAIPSFTVNAKGLITAASSNVVVAPAGTLTGTTLNSTVVTSSLTSVGTITSGTWTGTTIAIANGGTGTSTAPTQYGVIYASSTTTYASTAAGSAGQVLTSNGTSAPTFQTLSGGSFSYFSSNTSVYGGTFSTLSSATGANNTIVGVSAGNSLTSGSNNTFYGYQAGEGVISGANNTFVGYDAGVLCTSSTTTMLGASTSVNLVNAGSSILIGYKADNTGAMTTGDTDFILIGSANTITTSGSGGSMTNSVIIGMNCTIGYGYANNVILGNSVTLNGNSSNSIAIGNSTTSTQLSTVAIGFQTACSGQYAVAVGRAQTISGNFTVSVGANNSDNGANYSIILGNGTQLSGSSHTGCFIVGQVINTPSDPTTGSNQIIFGTSGVGAIPLKDMFIGRGAVGDGIATNVSIQPSPMVGSNLAGANLSLRAGNSTGTGAGGQIIFQTASASGSPSGTPNTLTTVGSIDSTGAWALGASSTTPTHVLNTNSTTGSGVGTLTNVPGITAGGNPTGYVEITINGTTAYIPYWT